jgi:hypothetical protein
MIPFLFGAFFGAAVGVAVICLVIDAKNQDLFNKEIDFDPWEEDEFWDDYHRNI